MYQYIGDGCMEGKKDLTLREMFQLTHDLEEMQETTDMLLALHLIDINDIKSIKKV